MNKVILVGNLARDPELRQTPNGVSVARFTVAVTRRYSKDGNNQTDFISCVAWRQQAEFLCRYFQKGSGIQLCGSIQSRSWDGQDGKRQYATEVVADELSFNGPKRDGSSNSGGYQNNGFQSNGFQNSNFSAPQMNNGFSAPAPQQAPMSDFDGFDDDSFSDIDGSEDDLPF